MRAMDDLRLGSVCRALRRRLGWRQSDLAARTGVSQDQISRIERGQLRGMPYHTLQWVFAALGARFDSNVLCRGGELDRLLEERHSRIVGQAAGFYGEHAWLPLREVTFQHFGDRGSIDLLGVHARARIASINEIKTDTPSAEETQRRHDVKVRLAAKIVEERCGWRPRAIGRILILPEDTRLRRIVAEHGFPAMYPADSREVRSWIREPSGPLAGIWFLSPTRGDRHRRVPGGPRRVRVSRPRTNRSPDRPQVGLGVGHDDPDA
jgi:transcriptional regulator with XRE-family HTH domain